LLVDDDDLIAQAIRMALPGQWRMVAVNSRGDLPANGSFSAAFVDMHLQKNATEAEGLEVVAELRRRDPLLEIVAISGDLDRDLMESCLRAGAGRFLAKPLSPEEVCLTLEKIEALHLLRMATARGTKAAWIGSGPASLEVQRQVASLRGEAGPILIEGESGTGKEVVAALISAQEPDRPFVAVNVAALPEHVFESEFFGHVRGAFTGADQNKMGLAEAAHGGDLFLDEIEALPLSQQAKLLRFLESGEIRRVGSKDSVRARVRVIAATNQNLSIMAREGRFREDLLWRLNGKKIALPPLRQRPEDIPSLVEHFFSRERPRRNKALSDDAIEALSRYPFPGNVRELKRACEQLSLTAPLPIVRAEDVARVLPLDPQPGAAGSSAFPGDPAATAGAGRGDSARSDAAGEPLELALGLQQLLSRHEARVIRAALRSSSAGGSGGGPDIDGAARLLKISRSSLYKKLKEHAIAQGG
jgi:DNA-binding NtrC family response regulator